MFCVLHLGTTRSIVLTVGLFIQQYASEADIVYEIL